MFRILQLFSYSLVFVLSSDYITIGEFPHANGCFTQGLQYYRNLIYESCGLYGKSHLQIIDPISSKIIKRAKIANKYFGQSLIVICINY
jgi:glutamine cyclotransferase